MDLQRIHDDVNRMRDRLVQRSRLCDQLVGALARGDGARATDAIRAMTDLESSPASVVAAIKDHLRQVEPGIRARLARLVDRTLGHDTAYHWVVTEALRLAREARGR